MNRLLELATEISHAQEDKTGINIRLGNQRRDLEQRQLNLVPLEGWPGKNSEERKINEQRAYFNDGICHAIQRLIINLEEALALVETALDTYTNERRALEWKIRAHLVEAITGHVITTQNGNGHQQVEDTAFDDFADDIADARLTEKFGENGHFEPLQGEFNYPGKEADETLAKAILAQRAHALELQASSLGIAEEEDIPF